jgi:uncharacterized protein YdhG (YjbR/CyaY superfamily)
MKEYSNIDEYIANYPENVQKILQKIRETILEVTPEAKEKIGYGIPTFTLNGKNLIHFGGYEKFVSLYPGAAAAEEFKEKTKNYKTSKGTIQFPIDQPIPYDLIKEITQFCINNR